MLLEKDTLDLVDVIECLGDRPYPMEEFMKEYLEQIGERKKQEEAEKKKAEEKKLEESLKPELATMEQEKKNEGDAEKK